MTEKKHPKITVSKVIKLATAFYIYKFGVWLMKLSYSLFVALFIFLALSGNLNITANVYFPLMLFIIGFILTVVGIYWSLLHGVKLSNSVLK